MVAASRSWTERASRDCRIYQHPKNSIRILHKICEGENIKLNINEFLRSEHPMVTWSPFLICLSNYCPSSLIL
jgi:hypothetical protein